MIRSFARYALIFVVTLGLCAALLTAVIGLIPQSAIQENCEKAAAYFEKDSGFPLLWKGHEGTRMDNYADCALLDVIYHADASRPLYSALAAPYYRNEGESIHQDFAASVREGLPPNSEYARYWHGSQVLVRPLLTVTSVEGCRAALFGLLMALNGWLAALLIRRRAVRALLIYLAGLAVVQVWVLAFSLEYIMTFLVMTAVCIAVTLNRREEQMTALFLVGGIVTSFVDFLTAETLVFTVPALLWLMLRREAGETLSVTAMLLRLVKWGFAWVLGYGLTFACKWGLVYGVLGGDALQNALSSAAYRMERPLDIVGSADLTISSAMSLPLVLARNIACLLPGTGGLTVSALGWIVAGTLLALAVLFYLFRGERTDAAFTVSALLVGLVPYLRFAVLSSHSADHFFFTYRAQMAAVMAAAAALVYGMDLSYALRGGKKKRRR